MGLKQKCLNNAKKSNYLGDKCFEETSMHYLENTQIFKDMNIREVVHDRARQLKGIDAIGSIGNVSINVDVKAIASQLNTFCFEISGNVSTNQVGWLINPKLETTHYLIVYHTVKGAERNYRLGKRIMTVNNVIETEALLIEKEKLKSFIQKELGQNLDSVVKEIRKQDLEGRGVVRFNKEMNVVKGTVNQKAYPTISLGLKEQPINVVVRKESLKELADKHWIIEDEKNMVTSDQN